MLLSCLKNTRGNGKTESGFNRMKVVKEENINLIIMLAHSEWRLEDFLFGRIKEEIIRKILCSILLIKEEPGKVAD